MNTTPILLKMPAPWRDCKDYPYPAELRIHNDCGLRMTYCQSPEERVSEAELVKMEAELHIQQARCHQAFNEGIAQVQAMLDWVRKEQKEAPSNE